MRSNRSRHRTVAQLAQRDLTEIPRIVVLAVMGVYRSLDGYLLENFLVGESSAALLLVLVLLARLREAGNSAAAAVAMIVVAFAAAAVPPR